MRTWKPLFALFAVTGVAMACGGDTPVEPPVTAEAGVHGTVTEDGAPVEGVTVQVFRADQGWSLGEDETGSDGAYAVTYPLAEEDELFEVVVTVAEEGYGPYEEVVPQGPSVQVTTRRAAWWGS